MSLLITNKCLTLLGSPSVAAPDKGKWASIIDAVVPSFYYLLLEQRAWIFTTRFQTLVLNSVNTNPRYQYSYKLPSDMIRIQEVYQQDAWDSPIYQYTTDGTNLYSDKNNVVIKYITNSADVDKTPESFKLALAYSIVDHLNAQLLNNTQLVPYYEKMATKYYAKAVNLDNTNQGELPKLARSVRYL